MGVGQNIKKWRERRYYSQTELARLVGISANSLYRIEKEAYNPRPQTVRKIAEVLAVSLEELTLEEDNKIAASQPETVEYSPEIFQAEQELPVETAPEIVFDHEVIQTNETQNEETKLNSEQVLTHQINSESEQPVTNLNGIYHRINKIEDQRALESDYPTTNSDKKRLLPFSKTAIILVSLLTVLILGLIAWNVIQLGRLNTLEATESLNQLGLNLLTSTETQNDRLNPVVQTTAQLHGHWFHQKGIDTEVFVIEFMPILAPPQAYYGWQQFNDGSWHEITEFSPDAKGYARVIVTGSDGSNVRKVEVTAQAAPSQAPAGTVVLAYP